MRTRKGEFVDLFAELQTQGFSRARVDGVVWPPARRRLKQEKHDIEVVVDRLVVKASAKQRLWTRWRRRCAWPTASSCSTSSTARRTTRTANAASPNAWPAPTGIPSPSTTSNRGRSLQLALRCVPGLRRAQGAQGDRRGPGGTDPELSPTEGAIAPWSRQPQRRLLRLMSGLADEMGFSVDTPWKRLPIKAATGDPERQRPSGARQVPQQVRPHSLVLHGVRGVMSFLSRRMDQTESEQMKERYEGYMRDVPVPVVPVPGCAPRSCR